MSVIYGFGGMRIRDGLLSFEPMLPKNWTTLSFKILYRGRVLQVGIEKDQVVIKSLEGEGLDLYLMGDKETPGGFRVPGGRTLKAIGGIYRSKPRLVRVVLSWMWMAWNPRACEALIL
jgi:hypothetical protein